jgi:outer membrane protein assembly factor BamB
MSESLGEGGGLQTASGTVETTPTSRGSPSCAASVGAFVTKDGDVVAFNKETSSVKWRKNFISSDRSLSVEDTDVLVSQNSVYVRSWKYFAAFDINSGEKTVWSGGRLNVLSVDCRKEEVYAYSRGEEELLCLCAQTGERKCVFSLETIFSYGGGGVVSEYFSEHMGETNPEHIWNALTLSHGNPIDALFNTPQGVFFTTSKMLYHLPSLKQIDTVSDRLQTNQDGSNQKRGSAGELVAPIQEGTEPVISNGRVYFVTPDGYIGGTTVGGKSPIWARSLSPTSTQSGRIPMIGGQEEDVATEHTLLSPVVSHGHVYAVSKQGLAAAFDIHDGELLWKTTIGTDGVSHARFHNGTLYATSDTHIYALDPDSGDIEWTFSTSDVPGVTYPFPLTAPSFHRDNLYVGTDGYCIHSLDTETGEHQWAYSTGKPVTMEPTVTEESVYVGGQNCRVHRIDRQSGNHYWPVSHHSSWYLTAESPPVAYCV